MLKITIPETEFFNQETNEFFTTKKQKLSLEHSLVSISKWESKWEKPFISSDKTNKENVDYVRCMTLTQNVDPLVYNGLTADNFEQINKYIDAPMTATWFSETKSQPPKEVITSEIIYYWMIAYNIPFECQKWHLNRLLTLINVCSIKQSGDKNKMSKQEILAKNRELNAARRAKLHTKG